MNDIIKKQKERDAELGIKLIETLREISTINKVVHENKTKEEIELDDFCEKKVLDVYDIQELFDIGIVKARKLMQIVPHYRVGNKDMCTRIDLYNAFVKNKLKIKW